MRKQYEIKQKPIFATTSEELTHYSTTISSMDTSSMDKDFCEKALLRSLDIERYSHSPEERTLCNKLQEMIFTKCPKVRI
ncbi:MAG: hypothetical protein AABW47_01665 [Nanoarchaeota archaeon]